MPATPTGTECHLEWRTTTVDGRVAGYGVAGTGPPLVFLHGWGLGQHAYKRALKTLVSQGLRVYAPALPSFGGTADLPAAERTLGGYARWVDRFLTAVEVQEFGDPQDGVGYAVDVGRDCRPVILGDALDEGMRDDGDLHAFGRLRSGHSLDERRSPRDASFARRRRR